MILTLRSIIKRKLFNTYTFEPQLLKATDRRIV